MNMGTNKRAGAMPDSEVPLKATRRRFGRDEILRILAEADKVAGTGRVAEVLRRERIYRNQLTDWQKRAQGVYGADKIPAGVKTNKPGNSKEIQKLQRHIASLEKELLHARTIIGIQKKVASLMGLPLETGPNAENG